tara:strand:- start:1321 stop:2622 length:1302 start_codon:yes stop_codon:yes gene_type:complete
VLLLGGKKKWNNWAGNQTSESFLYTPESEDQLIELIQLARDKKRNIRVVGSGHSFSSLVPTNDFIVDMKKFSGCIEFSKEESWAHFKSGTVLKDVNSFLFQNGQSLRNLGDVDVQTISGALATGTHGTGRRLPIISEDILEVTYVNGLGEIKTITENEPEKLQAFKVHLGLLGIITSIKVRTISSYKLHCVTKKMSLTSILKDFDRLTLKNRNFEFFWFPYTDYAQVKLMNETERKPDNKKISNWFNSIFLENLLYGFLIKLCMLFKSKIIFFSNLCIKFVSYSEKVDWSHQIYATPRWNKFCETEFSIPLEHIKPCLKKVREIIFKHKQLSIIPVEVRTVRQDNILLSPAFNRDSAYIAIHTPKGAEYRECYQEIERYMYEIGGRPHWGKISSLSLERCKKIYPQFEYFRRIRKDNDPEGIFLNKWTKELFI